MGDAVEEERRVLLVKGRAGVRENAYGMVDMAMGMNEDGLGDCGVWLRVEDKGRGESER